MTFKKQYLAQSISLILLTSVAASASAEDQAAVKLDTLEVNAQDTNPDSYTAPDAATATKMNLSLRETPQAVAVITQAQLDDFNATDLNAALDLTAGVTVERIETDRSYYTARGFDITNFQFDGVGLPTTSGNLFGDIDSAIAERIEVLKGANGLMSGTGNPSATVNIIRKRPTEEFAASASVSAGSWNQKRLEGDISGSLTESGNVRGRLVVAGQDGESYLDRYEKQRTLFYGVLEADISDATTVTLGHSTQDTQADSPMWGALTLKDTNGNTFDYDRSASTAADWAYWDNKIDSSFIELKQDLPENWQGTAVLNRTKRVSDSKLLYVYGSIAADGSGAVAYPSLYDKTETETSLDLYANGPFQFAGRTHDAIVGIQINRSESEEESVYANPRTFGINLDDAMKGNVADVPINGVSSGGNWDYTGESFYGAGRFSVTDQLSVLAGARISQLDIEGESYDKTKNTSFEGEVTPYLGAVYDLTDQHSLYASYTQIFTPQTELDVNGDQLDPVKGSNIEFGIKSEFIPGIIATAAVFKSQQDNVAEVAGTKGADSYYKGVDGVTSQGFEVDIAGELLPGWKVSAGYTKIKVEDADGKEVKKEVPKEMFTASSQYRPGTLPELKVGASVKWQGETENTVVSQKSYTLVNLMAGYDLTRNLNASLAINNLTDEKYLNSLYWDQAFYGAPRNVMAKVNWTY